ncbi:family 43 glycosylhydrolase [Duganella sp. Root198D2]|uniref:family 43 glycosylhydrolase n=1 Tax=Duganella sp. Root198D2 TaxID=1736489 RepID=UPI0009EC4A8B|nr:family 43 glycosylhydrolase [Duganella sp. Root198D2]
MRRLQAVLGVAWLAAGANSMAASGEAPYNAGTTFAKLAGQYPYIAVAAAEAPAPVRVLRNLTYAQRAEHALQLDLYLPGPNGGGDERPSPLVVLVHGGGWRSGTRENMAPLAARLAARGFAAATVDYRLSGEAQYPAAIDDVKQAVRWLRLAAPQYGLDDKRIAAAGGSAGGQIAALVGMTSGSDASSAVQAAINIDGLSDFTSEEARKHEDDPARNPSAAAAWLGGRYAEQEARWRDASPLTHAGAGSAPVLFVTSAQARFSVGREALAARLRQYKIPAEHVHLPGTPHSFWLFDPWLAPTVDAMQGFLERTLGVPQTRRAPWSPDLADGRYRNPILHADYSDPDVIRVGKRYYMTSSSFTNVPGLPLLESGDMVNWRLVGHALRRLVPGKAFRTPQHGKGVWAPCLRFRDGKFWIFYPDPDFGIYVITAKDFAGPWSKPRLIMAGKGLIDPAPLWDDDGKAWLLHGWAKSRAGFNNVLSLRPMAPDGSRMLDQVSRVVIDGNTLPGYKTLEGPKLYKRNGWYYVFAPAGGVESGWQSVFRSRHIDGPYEARIVMEQGSSSTNGPHQGAWVGAEDGGDWFYHFQDKRAFGRVVHLQPMRWLDDGWPLIGEPSVKPGVGQPVLEYAKPIAGPAPASLASGDEFGAKRLAPQWQWVANPAPGWNSLTARAGFLRLYAQPVAAPANGEAAIAPLRSLPAVLTQKPPAPVFTAVTKVDLHAVADGDMVGLAMYGQSYAWLGLRREHGELRVAYVRCEAANDRCKEQQEASFPLPLKTSVHLRMDVGAGGQTAFSYGQDGVHFTPAGTPFTAAMGRWVGAQIALFATGAKGSYADIDYLRITP